MAHRIFGNVGRGLKLVAWLFLLTGAGFACVEAALLFREARLRLDATAEQVAGLVRPTQQLEANWNAVAVSTTQVIVKERAAFDSQQAYFQQLKESTNSLSTRINALVDDSDATVKQVNNDLLPSARWTLDAGRDSLVGLGNDSRQVADAAGQTLSTAKIAIAAIGGDAESLKPTLDATAAVTQNLAVVSEDAKKVSDHYTALILAPASKVKAGILFAASIAGRVLRIF